MDSNPQCLLRNIVRRSETKDSLRRNRAMGSGRWERLISQPIGSSGSSLFSFNPFPDLQRERFSSCKVFRVWMLAVDASQKPQWAHSIPSAATELRNHFEATSNKPPSQSAVLKPAKEGKTGCGEEEDSARASWPGVNQLQQ